MLSLAGSSGAIRYLNATRAVVRPPEIAGIDAAGHLRRQARIVGRDGVAFDNDPYDDRQNSVAAAVALDRDGRRVGAVRSAPANIGVYMTTC